MGTEDLERRMGPDVEKAGRTAVRHPLDEDRFDNDGGEEAFEQPSTHNEYKARLERLWKYALCRTEMVQRSRPITEDYGNLRNSY